MPPNFLLYRFYAYLLNGVFANSWESVGTLSGEQVTDLSCTSPQYISHKRGIAKTWRNGFQVPIMHIYKFIRPAVGADLSCTSPIYRPNTHQAKHG